jgi:hypothetical protein
VTSTLCAWVLGVGPSAVVFFCPRTVTWQRDTSEGGPGHRACYNCYKYSAGWSYKTMQHRMLALRQAVCYSFSLHAAEAPTGADTSAAAVTAPTTSAVGLAPAACGPVGAVCVAASLGVELQPPAGQPVCQHWAAGAQNASRFSNTYPFFGMWARALLGLREASTRYVYSRT